MTNDNQDALRCAEYLHDRNRLDLTCDESAAHLRRLVAENEAKDALLRQAVEVMSTARFVDRRHITPQDYEAFDSAISAIRQHLDQKTT